MSYRDEIGTLTLPRSQSEPRGALCNLGRKARANTCVAWPRRSGTHRSSLASEPMSQSVLHWAVIHVHCIQIQSTRTTIHRDGHIGKEIELKTSRQRGTDRQKGYTTHYGNTIVQGLLGYTGYGTGTASRDGNNGHRILV